MITEKKSLSVAEAGEYLGGKSTENTEMVGFVKKFAKINGKEAKELREKLEGLDLIKLREEHISKIIDLLPNHKDDLSKIFVDVGLDEDESNKILDAVKEFR